MESGQGLVEYVLIIAVVALAAITALGFLSGRINIIFGDVGNTLNNVSGLERGSELRDAPHEAWSLFRTTAPGMPRPRASSDLAVSIGPAAVSKARADRASD